MRELKITKICRQGKDHSQWLMGTECREMTGPIVRYWEEKACITKPREEQ